MPAHRISFGDHALLRIFLDGAGDSLTSFRYFDKRPLDAVANHVCTWLWVEDGKPLAYGHLDNEDGITWLGIAVQEQPRGKGYVKWM